MQVGTAAFEGKIYDFRHCAVFGVKVYVKSDYCNRKTELDTLRIQ